MKIKIKAKANSKVQSVEKIDDTNFIVSVRESPIDGKANKAIMKALAKYFGVSSINIKIISGRASKQKIIEIKE